jgi:hypothetical protein
MAGSSTYDFGGGYPLPCNFTGLYTCDDPFAAGAFNEASFSDQQMLSLPGLSGTALLLY